MGGSSEPKSSNDWKSICTPELDLRLLFGRMTAFNECRRKAEKGGAGAPALSSSKGRARLNAPGGRVPPAEKAIQHIYL
jgi:hypothetical protein